MTNPISSSAPILVPESSVQLNELQSLAPEHERADMNKAKNSASQACSSGELKVKDKTTPVAKPFVCTICLKGFGHNRNLIAHMRTHSTEKPFACDQCVKTFAHEISLKRHKLIHSGKKPFVCSECGMSFTRHDVLTQHQRKHTGEKPYQCAECGKKFAAKGNLDTHKITHTEENPFVCFVCEQSFTQKSNLNRHMKNFHPNACHLQPLNLGDLGDLGDLENGSDVDDLDDMTKKSDSVPSSRMLLNLAKKSLIQGQPEPSTSSSTATVSSAADVTPAKYEPLYSCPLCGGIFNTWVYLTRHMSTCHTPAKSSS